MSDIKKVTEQTVFKEYEKDREYKIKRNLYANAKQHENFFIGNQWDGVNAPDLEKPVLNFIKSVINYLISVLVVNDVGISFRNFVPLVPHEVEQMTPLETEFIKEEKEKINEDILSREIERINENTKFKSKLRELLHNGAVHGDMCLYSRFNTDLESQGQPTSGDIETEIIDSTNICFGNPYSSEVEKQPYIIIQRRELTVELQKKYPKLEDEIHSDENDESFTGEKSEDDTTTVLTRFYKVDKEVCFLECTRTAVLTPETRTGQSLYPIAFSNWEKIKNSYHGVGAMEYLIPNQIAVNKLWAMALLYAKNNSFPKIFIDKTKLERWSNEIGSVMGVAGNPNDAVASSFRAYDMSQQIFTLVDKTIDMSKNFMGANSAALGEVRPDNTSAIIALQKSSAAPLELQRLSLNQFIEDHMRILYDIIKSSYGKRYVSDVNDVGIELARLVDFSALAINSQLVVDIGPSDYWSELSQTMTNDNLFKMGVITDPVTYLDNIPDKQMKNKNKIIADVKKQMQRQQEMMQLQQGGGLMTSG